MAAALLARPVAHYIRRKRDSLTGDGSGLSGNSKLLLSDYFSSLDLDRARIVEVSTLPLPVPLFSHAVRLIGIDIPDPSLIAGITFDHVIAVREPMGTAMLFHELVHVVQFRLLGVEAFARLYACGLFSTARYEDIPLEQCAYQLEARFELGPAPFSVENEVSRWMERGLF